MKRKQLHRSYAKLSRGTQLKSLRRSTAPRRASSKTLAGTRIYLPAVEPSALGRRLIRALESLEG